MINANKDKNDPIYFTDATHPQHNSIPSYGWIKKGQEKELKANCGRQQLNINGAINIETLEPTTGFYDTINADSTIDLFSKIEAKHPNTKTIYIYEHHVAVSMSPKADAIDAITEASDTYMSWDVYRHR